VEQLAARVTHTHEVAGSSPAPATSPTADGNGEQLGGGEPPHAAAETLYRRHAIANLRSLGRLDATQRTREQETLIEIEIGRLRWLARVQAER
jgi:hypothetical protein